MAQIVHEFPVIVRQRVSKYPWETWFDGQIRILKRGTDFDCKHAVSFAQAVYQQAKARGLCAKVRIIDRSRLAIQATPRVSAE